MSETCRIPPGGSPGVPRGANWDTHTKAGREASKRLSDRVPKPTPAPKKPETHDVASLIREAQSYGVPVRSVPKTPKQVQSLHAKVMKHRQRRIDDVMARAARIPSTGTRGAKGAKPKGTEQTHGWTPEPPSSMKELEALEALVARREAQALRAVASEKGHTFNPDLPARQELDRLLGLEAAKPTRRRTDRPASYSPELRADEVGPGAPSSRQYAGAKPPPRQKNMSEAALFIRGQNLDATVRERMRTGTKAPTPAEQAAQRKAEARARREDPGEPVPRSMESQYSDLWDRAEADGLVRRGRDGSIPQPRTRMEAERFIKEIQGRIRHHEVDPHTKPWLDRPGRAPRRPAKPKPATFRPTSAHDRARVKDFEKLWGAAWERGLVAKENRTPARPTSSAQLDTWTAELKRRLRDYSEKRRKDA